MNPLLVAVAAEWKDTKTAANRSQAAIKRIAWAAQAAAVAVAASRKQATLDAFDQLSAQDVALFWKTAEAELDKREEHAGAQRERAADLRRAFDFAVSTWCDCVRTEVTGDSVAESITAGAQELASVFRSDRLPSRAKKTEGSVDELASEACAVLAVTVLVDRWLPGNRTRLLARARDEVWTGEVLEAWEEESDRGKRPTDAEAEDHLVVALDALSTRFSARHSRTNTTLSGTLSRGLLGATPVGAFDLWIRTVLARSAFPLLVAEPDARLALRLGEVLLDGHALPSDVHTVVANAATGIDVEEDRGDRSAWQSIRQGIHTAVERATHGGRSPGQWDIVLAGAVLSRKVRSARGEEPLWLPVVERDVFGRRDSVRVRAALRLNGSGISWSTEKFRPAGLHIVDALSRNRPGHKTAEIYADADAISRDTERRLRTSLLAGEELGRAFEFRGVVELNKYVKGASDFARRSFRTTRPAREPVPATEGRVPDDDIEVITRVARVRLVDLGPLVEGGLADHLRDDPRSIGGVIAVAWWAWWRERTGHETFADSLAAYSRSRPGGGVHIDHTSVAAEVSAAVEAISGPVGWESHVWLLAGHVGPLSARLAADRPGTGTAAQRWLTWWSAQTLDRSFSDFATTALTTLYPELDPDAFPDLQRRVCALLDDLVHGIDEP